MPKATRNSKNTEAAESTATEEKKPKTIDDAMAEITKKYGAGAIMRLGESACAQVEVISTGDLGLDRALGVWGLPRGRIIEIMGPTGGGKTTLTLSILAECQKAGGVATFIDAEHSLDAAYATKVGVNVDDLIFVQPDSGEQGLDILETLIDSEQCPDVIIVDSVAALTPQAEIDGSMEDNQPGLQARMMGKAMRKLTAKVAKSRTCVIFINQLRQKIGVMFGNPETTPGGEALRFFASVRLDIRKIEVLKKDGSEIGNRVKVKVLKNKVAPPFKNSEFNIIFGKGIDKTRTLLDLAVEFDLIQKSGAWFSYNGERIGQGYDQTCEYIATNKELYSTLERSLKETLSEKK